MLKTIPKDEEKNMGIKEKNEFVPKDTEIEL